LFLLQNCPKSLKSPVDRNGRHADSCRIAAEMLRPHSAEREEAQLRPAESEVPGVQINSPIITENLPANLILSCH
jgi:hypothetical protein